MHAIRSVAVNVFRESVRDKVLYNLVLFAVLLIATSSLLGQLTAGQEFKIMKDVSLAAAALFGLFIAVFIGIGLVSKEVEKRSLYAVLTKPVQRHQFIAGKYAGLVLTLVVNLVVMTMAIYAVLGAMAWLTPPDVRSGWEVPPVDPALLKALVLILLELMLVTAIALFFSTFSSPILAAVFTVSLYVVGHFNADLRSFEHVVRSRIAAACARGLYYVLPNFAAFDVKAQVVHAQPVPWSYMAWAAVYATVYVTALLLAAMFVFSRRDLK
jgi:ABC-type transport system involved in multi-copper enzyme maturation permease subunit